VKKLLKSQSRPAGKQQSKQKDIKGLGAKMLQKSLKKSIRKKLVIKKSQKCSKEPRALLNKSKSSKHALINFCADGTVKSIYYDEIRKACTKSGAKNSIHVERITDVEFDNDSQQWVARLISTGQIIAKNKIRETVLIQEVKIASEMIFNGVEILPSKST
jgi:hypothetical protein